MGRQPRDEPGRWEAVIGLEVHAQLRTGTKIFCACPNDPAAPPNTCTCPVCLGLPGTLPVLGRQAVVLGLRAALALRCDVGVRSTFARKHYFYPDLPKGYQITQDERPLATGGHLSVPQGEERELVVPLTRVHLEEDAGRSYHGATPGKTGLDFNRCGVPLLELVTEPALRSPEQAAEFVRELRALLRTLGVCDGNMEDGSLRCDANLSLRRAGSRKMGTRTEVKNLNSLRHLRLALQHEQRRQAAILDGGGRVHQETRLFDEASGSTSPLRSKEESDDYRYFPEPDLPDLMIDPELLGEARAGLPELPADRRQRYRARLGLSGYAAAVLSAEAPLSAYFDAVLVAGAAPKAAANWVSNELLACWDREGPPPVAPERTAELLELLATGELTGPLAKTVWARMLESGRSAGEIMASDGLRVAGDLGPLVADTLQAHPRQVAQYRAGKHALLGFFIGAAMRASGGSAPPDRLRSQLVAALEEDE